MREEDKKKFAVILGSIAESAGKNISKNRMKTYFEALKGFSIEQIEEAGYKLLLETDFFPTIRMFRDAIIGDIETNAEIAYNKLIKARREEGSYKTVIFDDPIIHRIIDVLGGWIRVCEMNYEDEKFTAFKKNFLEMYKKYSEAKDKYDYEYPTKLIGRQELENSNSGFDEFIGDAVYIGTAKSAMKWFMICGDKEQVKSFAINQYENKRRQKALMRAKDIKKLPSNKVYKKTFNTEEIDVIADLMAV